MADASYVQSSFIGGEFSLSIQARYDRPEYRTGMARCFNGMPIETGAWVRRPGFLDAGLTYGGLVGKVIKFDFQTANPYTMEFTDGHMRFWSGTQIVPDSGAVVNNVLSDSPTSVLTVGTTNWAPGDYVYFSGVGSGAPLLEGRVFIIISKPNPNQFTIGDGLTGANIAGISWPPGLSASVFRVMIITTPYASALAVGVRSVQTENTAFILNASVVPYALTVTVLPTPSNFATFSFAAATFNDGPYLDPVTNGLQVTPSAVSGAPTFTLSFPNWVATKVYQIGTYADEAGVTYRSILDQNVGHLPSANPLYWVSTIASAGLPEGSLTSAYVGRLVRFLSEPNEWDPTFAYSATELASYNPSGQPGSATYWTSILAGAGTNTGNVPGQDLVNWELVPANATIWTWGKIVSVASTSFVAELFGPPLLYAGLPVRTWRLGVYTLTALPTCGTYSDGRLWLSGAVPNRVDACVANGIDGSKVNFAPTDQSGVVAPSNAISYTFNAPDANPILWMVPDQQGIICGTKAGEWLIGAPTAGAITPFNISARRITKIGCANIEPARTEHTTLFVQKHGRKIMEYFADVMSGKFTAPHITYTGKHLTVGNVVGIAYQQELVPTVWAHTAGGRLIACTYKRDTLTTTTMPIAGWHQHSLGSAAVVDSMTVGPSSQGNVDALTMIVHGDDNRHHVYVLAELIEEGASLSQAMYLDGAIIPSSTAFADPTGDMPYGGLKLNGLWSQNSTLVTAWIGGLDCGDYVVVNGSITVPYGDGISAGTAEGLFTAEFFGDGATMFVGYTYTSEGQIVRPNSPQESGARTGPAFGKLRRHQMFTVQLEGTRGISFGTGFTGSGLLPALFKNPNGQRYNVSQTFTGIFRDSVRDNDTYDGQLCWQITRPYPANVLAIGGHLQTKDA